MTRTTTSLVAVFRDSASAQSAKQELVNNGFTDVELRSSDGSYQDDAARGNSALTGTIPEAHSGGGIGGWFRSMFGSDNDDSSHYAQAVERGGTAVTVRTEDAQADLAADILNRYGAIDIDEHSNASGNSLSSGVTSGIASSITPGEEGTIAIPVVEEELAVGKRAVRRGGVRVITSVSERPVEEQVTLRDETVRVERRAVDRPATEADLSSHRGPIELTEVDEEAVIGKQARVVEEVVVGKETTERTETIRDTVRRTEVDVEETTGTQDTRTNRRS